MLQQAFVRSKAKSMAGRTTMQPQPATFTMARAVEAEKIAAAHAAVAAWVRQPRRVPGLAAATAQAAVATAVAAAATAAAAAGVGIVVSTHEARGGEQTPLAEWSAAGAYSQHPLPRSGRGPEMGAKIGRSAPAPPAAAAAVTGGCS